MYVYIYIYIYIYYLFTYTYAYTYTYLPGFVQMHGGPAFFARTSADGADPEAAGRFAAPGSY